MAGLYVSLRGAVVSACEASPAARAFVLGPELCIVGKGTSSLPQVARQAAACWVLTGACRDLHCFGTAPPTTLHRSSLPCPLCRITRERKTDAFSLNTACVTRGAAATPRGPERAAALCRAFHAPCWPAFVREQCKQDGGPIGHRGQLHASLLAGLRVETPHDILSAMRAAAGMC